MNLEETEIEIPGGYRVWLKEGWDERKAGFTVVIKGKRLCKVFRELCEGKRQDVHPCKDGNDETPYVESVTIEVNEERGDE
jgi:hypothetical protein